MNAEKLKKIVASVKTAKAKFTSVNETANAAKIRQIVEAVKKAEEK